MERCSQILTEKGYSKNVISDTQSVWKRLIIPYLKERKTENYSVELGKSLLSDLFSSVLYGKGHHGLICRSLRYLDDILTYGYIRAKSDSKVLPIHMEGLIGNHIELFLTEQKKLHKAASTIKTYTAGLITFNNFCKDHDISKYEEINLELLCEYISTHSRARITCVRLFFDFLYREEMTPNNLAVLISFCPKKEIKKISAVYSNEEILQIEKSAKKKSKAGIRDYAILLLTTRLGLRASDVANLKLNDIDWENSRITLCQHKTNQNVTLPLLNEVGNAIIAYLKHARPVDTKKTGKVFLRAAAPYDKDVDSTVVSNVIRKLIQGSGVKIGNRRYGPHSMRHSLATTLLEQGAILPTISSVLGHKSTETTKQYVEVSIKKLMNAVHFVDAVNPDFYKQNNMVFYEGE